MKEILFFSNNKNKILEISNLFSQSKTQILNLNDFNKIDSPKETGRTFEENANIKSFYGLINFKKNCFADDSGICIEAIDGQPGVTSKQFLLSDKSHINIFNKIIDICIRKNNFAAYFQTTICLSLSKTNHIFFSGKVKGKISKTIRGCKGFGYDPIFIPNGHNNTFAEMSVAKKNLISHRSIAISKLKKYLDSI